MALRAWTLGIIVLAAIVLIVESSQSFQTCVKDAQYQTGEDTLQKSFTDVSILIGRRKDCLKLFIHQNEGAITALATMLIALFTLTLWQSSEKMWRVTRQSADAAEAAAQIAKANLVSTQRAFVVPGGLKWRPVHDQTGKIVWEFYGIWRNSGNTPTRNLRAYIVKAFGIRVHDVDDPFGASFGMNAEDQKRAVPNFIGPKGEIENGPVRIDGTDLAAVQQGTAPFVIGGVATYESILPGDKPHITKFCVYVTEVTGNPLIADSLLQIGTRTCRTNNCADEECG